MTEPVLKIDYNELPVCDVAEAKQFYAAAFGWTFQDYGPDYAEINNAGLAGGLAKAASTARGGPVVVLKADDLPAAEQRVEAAGGQIVARHDFPGGRRFHFLDPAGNELAVWSPNGKYGE